MASDNGFEFVENADDIRRTIEQRSNQRKITCAEAFNIAADMNISPEIIGKLTDDLGIKLTHCQLGLFGHSPDRKKVTEASDIPEDLKNAVMADSEDGRISCRTVWNIALRLQVARQNVSNACEGLKIRIKPCQLGAF